jgi:hypothetical protein
MTSSSRRWDVTLAESPDGELFAEVAAFFNEWFPAVHWPTTTPSMFRWKLGPSNPAGRGVLAVASEGTTIVGVLTLTMKRYILDGSPVLVAEMGDGYTHPRLRRGGRARTWFAGTSSDDDYANKSIFGRLALELTDLARAKYVDIVFGTPNQLAHPHWVGSIGYVEARAGIRSWHRPGLSLVPGMPRGAARVADRLLGGIGRGLAGRPRGLSFGGMASSSEVDDLWRSSASGRGLEAVQDGAWFRHRYDQHPDAAYDIVSVRDAGHLVAVLAGRRLVRPSGHSTYSIADWLVAPDVRPALPGIVGEVLSTVAGVDSISLWTNGSTLRPGVLRRLGFMRPRAVPIVVAPSPAGVRAIAAEWDMRMAWSDNV